MAIEPWHVLGEEVGSQGTARYVDSSVERLQVRVTGMTDGRHVVTCNGRRVPLRADRPARRERRRRALSRLAAALGAASDHRRPRAAGLRLVDTWNGYSIGGCTYHVAHPGGRSYDDFPVNANEAEARRVARFWPYGHTPGPDGRAARGAQSGVPVHARPPAGGWCADTDAVANPRRSRRAARASTPIDRP